MPVVAVGVRQAVVEHTPSAAGTRHPLDALLDVVRRILTAAQTVAVGVEHLVAVDALETRKRLLTKELPVDRLPLL